VPDEFEQPGPATAPAAVEPAPGDELESSQLAARLRTLDWPAPADDVRERCFEQLMKRVEAEPHR
jgi:hypothetical protein